MNEYLQNLKTEDTIFIILTHERNSVYSTWLDNKIMLNHLGSIQSLNPVNLDIVVSNGTDICVNSRSSKKIEIFENITALGKILSIPLII